MSKCVWVWLVSFKKIPRIRRLPWSSRRGDVPTKRTAHYTYAVGSANGHSRSCRLGVASRFSLTCQRAGCGLRSFGYSFRAVNSNTALTFIHRRNSRSPFYFYFQLLFDDFGWCREVQKSRTRICCVPDLQDFILCAVQMRKVDQWFLTDAGAVIFLEVFKFDDLITSCAAVNIEQRISQKKRWRAFNASFQWQVHEKERSRSLKCGRCYVKLFRLSWLKWALFFRTTETFEFQKWDTLLEVSTAAIFDDRRSCELSVENGPWSQIFFIHFFYPICSRMK
jgi:hypothetical protein